MPAETATRDTLDQKQLLAVLMAFKKGDFSARMPFDQTGIAGKIADTLNDVIAMNEKLATAELAAGSEDPPVQQFLLSIAVVRHLLLDPVLPVALLPEDWPADELRRTYRRFDETFNRRLLAP